MSYPALRGPQKEPQGPGPPWWGSRLLPVCFGQCLSVSICDISSPLNIQRGRSNQTSFFSWLRERPTFAEYCLCLSILLAFKQNDEGGGGRRQRINRSCDQNSLSVLAPQGANSLFNLKTVRVKPYPYKNLKLGDLYVRGFAQR
jgi:hypothetical protein